MFKLNEKGFMMVETLIAAVFAMTIFTLIYVNFYPLIGEYEKREVYDDIDGKYSAYWIKRIIQSNSTKRDFIDSVNKETYKRANFSDAHTKEVAAKNEKLNQSQYNKLSLTEKIVKILEGNNPSGGVKISKQR